MTIDELPTPCLVIDALVVRRNLAKMSRYAEEHGIAVRPHTKTHKSGSLARAQLDAGAAGLTVATVGEAEVMADVCDDLLLAYPTVDRDRCRRVAALASRCAIRVALDSVEAAEALHASLFCKADVGVLVDVDVGLGRTGVQDAAAAVRVAAAVTRLPRLRLDGVFCYPGHICAPPAEQGLALAQVAERLAEVLDRFRACGFDTGVVSGGSTPTAYQSHQIPQLTEIRPGTYVFNDMNTVRGGFCTLDDCAARVVCTVVSTAVPGQVVVDAGSKALASDLCAPARESGYGHVVEYPAAKITRLSEEHAQVDVTGCDRIPHVGDRIRIIPNHVCPCVNLQEAAWWDDGEGELERLELEARRR